MSRKPPATAADYMIVAINPALIMLLVGSVLFFLCEVFYRGQYEGRLTFICAMYVMGIVAVSRISMEEGTGYAAGFGAPLAAVVYIAFFKFVEFHGPLAVLSPLLNGVFLIFTWWLAYNLTWDCTLLDDKADASGQGLLEAAGFDVAAGDSTNSAAAPAVNASAPVPAAPERPNRPLNAAEKLLAEKEKYERERLEEPSFFTTWFEADRRPRAQGVWVLWFAAIALPIFGVMQWFVPTSDTDSRVWCLQLLLVYVGSSLALLLNTSFLSLRRYLRQRKLEMPLEMAGVWMIVGASLIGGVMLFCLLLPRPGAEVAISKPPITFGNSGLNPSNWGMGNDGKQQPGGSGQNQPGKQQGASSTQQSSGQNAPQGSNSQGSQSTGSQSAGSKSSGGQGAQGQGSQGQGSQGQGSKGQGSQSQGGQPSGSSPPQNQPPQQNATNSPSGSKSDPASGQNQQTKTGPENGTQQPSAQQNSGQQNSGQQNPGEQSSGQQSSGQTPGKSPSSSNPGPQPMPGASPSQNSSGNSGAKSPESGSQTAPTPNQGKQPEKAPSNPPSNSSPSNSPPSNSSSNNAANNSPNNSANSSSPNNPSSGDPSKNDPSKSDPNAKTNPGEKNDPSKTDSAGKSPEANKTSPSEPAKTNPSGSSNSSSPQSSSQSSTSQTSQSNPPTSSAASSPPPSPPRQSNFRLPSVQVPASLGNLLKLLLWAAIAVAIVVGLIRYREQLLAAWKQLLDELAKLWARLFGGGEIETAATVAATAKAVTPPRPFASYPNPFTSGLAARMPPPQLMGHTLAAAEAFGRERGFPRDESETPHEYLARLFQQSPEIVQMALAFAETYGQIAFGKGAPPQQAHATSQRLWQVMSTTPPPPPPMPTAPQLQTSHR